MLPIILRNWLLSLRALFKYLSVLFTNNFSWEIFNWSCQQKWCHFWLYQAKVIIALNLLYEEKDCLRFLLPSISFSWRSRLSEHFAVSWLFCRYRFSWFTVDHVYENLGCLLNSWINCITEVLFLIIFSYIYLQTKGGWMVNTWEHFHQRSWQSLLVSDGKVLASLQSQRVHLLK